MDVALTSFFLGLLSTLSPCALPMYPGFLAYLSGQGGAGQGRSRYFLGLFVLAGVLTTMVALGGLIALLSVSIARALSILIPLAVVALLALGILLILDRNPFHRLPQLQFPGLRRASVNAFVYGALYGPLAMPCSGPTVVAIFVYSFTLGEAVRQLWAFIWFGLGLGVPLLVLSMLSGMLGRDLTRWFAIHRRAFNVAGGVLLIAVALYALADNWSMLALYYG